MMADLKKQGRLALRVEGTLWVAYWAELQTMEGAVFLGSIRLAFVQEQRNSSPSFVPGWKPSCDPWGSRQSLRVRSWRPRMNVEGGVGVGLEWLRAVGEVCAELEDMLPELIDAALKNGLTIEKVFAALGDTDA